MATKSSDLLAMESTLRLAFCSVNKGEKVTMDWSDFGATRSKSGTTPFYQLSADSEGLRTAELSLNEAQSVHTSSASLSQIHPF